MPVPEPNYAQQAQNCRAQLQAISARVEQLDTMKQELDRQTESIKLAAERYIQQAATLQRENGALKSDLAAAREQLNKMSKDLVTASNGWQTTLDTLRSTEQELKRLRNAVNG